MKVAPFQPGSEFSLLGLDIGGTKIAGAVVTFAATAPGGDAPRISLEASIPTGARRGGARVLADIADFAERQIAAASAAGTPVRGIAIASAGVVDVESGCIASATDTMPGWGG
ncbi:ROK family protein, partial [Actinotignum timonense]|nr:ROK family protein [Actinotignum timonense]